MDSLVVMNRHGEHCVDLRYEIGCSTMIKCMTVVAWINDETATQTPGEFKRVIIVYL